jgi:hypothetical protein
MPPSSGVVTLGIDAGITVVPDTFLLGPLFGVYTFLPVLKSYLSNPGVNGSYIYTLGGWIEGVDELDGVDAGCVTVVGAVAPASARLRATSAAPFPLPPDTPALAGGLLGMHGGKLVISSPVDVIGGNPNACNVALRASDAFAYSA